MIESQWILNKPIRIPFVYVASSQIQTTNVHLANLSYFHGLHLMVQDVNQGVVHRISDWDLMQLIQLLFALTNKVRYVSHHLSGAIEVGQDVLTLGEVIKELERQLHGEGLAGANKEF